MKKNLKRLYNKSKEEYFEYLRKNIKDNKKTFIITANPETFMLIEKDKEINDMFNDKKVSIVPDGIGLIKTCNLLNIDIKERIAGIDIAVKLFELSDEMKKKVYLFGSSEETIIAMKKKIKENYPGIKLVGATNGYIIDKDNEMDKIAKTKPDVVMVALGIPAQEKLIYKHLDKFDKGIFIGVGGSFDVISGIKKRAPKIFIKLNCEWLYRLLKEPKRIKRFYNSNIKFLFKVLKIKYGKIKYV